jgi:uncharacterized protein
VEPSELSPSFVIPRGTQVVLRSDRPAAGPPGSPGGERAIKKRGSVGEVIESPLTNEYAYSVRFADGSIVRAKKADLAIRRSEAPEDALPPHDVAAFEPHVFYRVRLGSRAFGLAGPDSDEDERGVYLPPAAWHWSLQKPPEEIQFRRAAGRVIEANQAPAGEGEDDITWWEIEKFLRLALKANPNILETLYVPEAHVLHADDLGRKLRDLREKFLSKHLYQTYSGYVLSQFRKFQRGIAGGGTYKPKHAMHLIRLLYSGIEALRGNGIMVDVGRYREELLRIKVEAPPFEEVHRRALELDAVFQSEFERTKLPERPDVEAVDRFLIEARRTKA